ncbi:drought resistance protein, partial [Trifolium medium]|nr:drought resistance protein [Trifolium medium]
MMASHRSIFATSILLFALLAIASATDYGYGPTPNTEKSKPKTE